MTEIYAINGSPCDRCEAYEYMGRIAWGRELNDAEKKFNALLETENKLYWCSYYERFFNKSFKKKKRHCAAEDEEESI